MKLLNFEIGEDKPLFLIAGPCIIESEEVTFQTAKTLKEITQSLHMNFIFKCSFDKANRTSHKSFRGLGIEKGLAILKKIKKELHVPILTDVHEDSPLEAVAQVADVLQTPAFLCRQTNFMQRVAKIGLPVNIKKGQFLAPEDMKNVVAKMRDVGNHQLMVCERGVSFGYHNLVVDMRSLVIMRETKCPVIFDATHSVQLPSGEGHVTGGQREFIPVLARAAVAVGIAGIFMETHPDPDNALSDGPNSWYLDQMKPLLEKLQKIDGVVKAREK
ncbi:MAG: 3-deoxy-8-phosphooctulonate synthase [Gammaproteobacteria bacterium RIFOXYB2_FULL_38_6]|nr:MAG: 3-deoxy-8-phosphooctulonate synthase [Gammaproteobacteria bacterium RIFOXYB2_FULL_38_6]